MELLAVLVCATFGVSLFAATVAVAVFAIRSAARGADDDGSSGS